MRAASEKLLSLNQPLAPHPGPRLEAPPEEGQGRYSRREAGRREQGIEVHQHVYCLVVSEMRHDGGEEEGCGIHQTQATVN